MITVVAALIEKDGKYLIARRIEGSEYTAGRWEFPGGKVEENETEEQAIEREMMEEFEVEVKATKFITNNLCKYPDKTIDLRLYECKHLSGYYKLHDHYEYKFVTKEELEYYIFCPADDALVEYVIRRTK